MKEWGNRKVTAMPLPQYTHHLPPSRPPSSLGARADITSVRRESDHTDHMYKTFKAQVLIQEMHRRVKSVLHPSMVQKFTM